MILFQLFVRVNFWGQVVEMNFSSFIFDKLLKTVSFSASWGEEDALFMMFHHTWTCFLEKKIWNIHKHSLKYKILEDQFKNSSSEAATIVFYKKTCS